MEGHALRLVIVTTAALSILAAAAGGHALAQVNPGGFLEKTTSGTVRPIYTPSQIASFVPARGAFTFPSPYNTEAVRLTNGSDCGGTDCVQPVGYSYWANMNNH